MEWNFVADEVGTRMRDVVGSCKARIAAHDAQVRAGGGDVGGACDPFKNQFTFLILLPILLIL